MLRGLLGEDVFWPAVTTYIQRFAGKTAEVHNVSWCTDDGSAKVIDLRLPSIDK